MVLRDAEEDARYERLRRLGPHWRADATLLEFTSYFGAATQGHLTRRALKYD
jgi:hypothetical protein